MNFLKILSSLIDLPGIRMDLWHFFSDYILFLNTKLFALVRGLMFNLLGGRHSIAYVYKGCRFYSFRDVLLGRNVILENRCRISGPIEIGSDTTVCEGVVITGSTKVGSGCLINYHTWIDRYVILADRVAMGHRSFLITFNHDYSDPTARSYVRLNRSWPRDVDWFKCRHSTRR